MADLFPYEMVNVTDLRIERLGGRGDFNSEAGSRSVVVSGQQAIIARNQDLTKALGGEELRLVADIYLPPNVTGVLRGDRAHFRPVDAAAKIWPVVVGQ